MEDNTNDEPAVFIYRIGVSLDKLDTLSVMHIAGTKGKGTTAALCESILRKHGYRTGFFSSPHLVQARERIRLNGEPLSPQQFADNIEDIYSRLDKVKVNILPCHHHQNSSHQGHIFY